MDLFLSPWDVFSPIIVWLLGIPVVRLIGKHFNQSQSRSIFLYAWHTIWCIAYVFFSLNGGADSVTYYIRAVSAIPEFSLGTAAVVWLTLIPAGLFKLSYLATSLVYNIIGTLGYLSLDSMLRSLAADKSLFVKKLASLVILLPSISFWSSAIGKDALAFTATCLALWSVLHLQKRALLTLLSIALMLIVRPHVALILVLSLALDLIFKRQVSPLLRVFIFAILSGALLLLIPFVSSKLAISDVSDFSEVSAFIDKRQGYNQEGGGGIDISGMPLYLQMSSYLFRPALFDVNSMLSMAAAIDNLILFVVLAIAVSGILRGRRLTSVPSHIFMLVYSSVLLAIFSATTANLGIAIRQKWMFLPMLLYIAFSLAKRSRFPVTSNLSSLTS